MAAGERLKSLLDEAEPKVKTREIARVTGKPATTVSAWLNEENALSRAKKDHVEWVKAVLEFLKREDAEHFVWFGSWGRGAGPEPVKSTEQAPPVAKVLLDYLRRENLPPIEQQKAAKALEVVLGL